MVTFRSLPVLAVRRMLGNWRLLSSVVVGTVIAATIISATAIYSDAIRDLGLDFALQQQRPAELDVKVLQSNLGVDRVQYRRSRDRVDGGVAAALAASSAGLVRMGTSATFYPTPPGGAVSERDDRPRAVLRFRSALEDHIEVVQGEFPRPLPEADDSPVPVAVGLETATRNGIRIGSGFDIHPFWDPEADPLPVVVVGIIEAVDPRERYWGVDEQVIDRRTRSWETLAMLVPETTFFGAMTELAEGVQADFDTLYDVALGTLNSRNGPSISGALNALERNLSGTEERLHVDTQLVEVLETYDEKLFFTRLPLLVLMLQIGGIVAYYLVMVSTMLVERQANELALLRSRGATTAQLLVQYGIEGTLLAVLAAVTGPPLAATVISLLGLTPAFRKPRGRRAAGGERLVARLSARGRRRVDRLRGADAAGVARHARDDHRIQAHHCPPEADTAVSALLPGRRARRGERHRLLAALSAGEALHGVALRRDPDGPVPAAHAGRLPADGRHRLLAIVPAGAASRRHDRRTDAQRRGAGSGCARWCATPPITRG